MPYDKSWAAIRQPWKVDQYFDADVPRKMNLPANGFDVTNAWWCAEFSRLAYQTDEERVLSELSQKGFQDVVELSAGRSFALSFKGQAENGDLFTVLAFRGTDSLTDWIGNFKVTPEQWSAGGAVHKGFVEAYQLIRSQIDLVMQTSERVVLTGHSLGGSLALLTASAYRLKTQFVYTFGSPKVGNALFNRSLEEISVFRMTNPNDVVPLVPPSTNQINFQHCGDLYQVNDAERVVEQQTDSQETLKELNLTYDPNSTLLSPPRFVSDHAPSNYVLPLNQLMKKD